MNVSLVLLFEHQTRIHHPCARRLGARGLGARRLGGRVAVRPAV